MTTQPPVVVPSLSDFETALANVRQVAIETPTLHSKFLSELVGQQVFLKCENLSEPAHIKCVVHSTG
jgi:threonine dehydratase